MLQFGRVLKVKSLLTVFETYPNIVHWQVFTVVAFMESGKFKLNQFVLGYSCIPF